MTKKSTKKNVGYTLLYGISTIVVSIAAFIATFIWLFQVVIGNKEFSSKTLSVFLIVSFFTALIGYALLKAGKPTK